jgi:hypothetical protein
VFLFPFRCSLRLALEVRKSMLWRLQ